MTKLDLQTPDFVAANAARLAELFPTCATETRQPDGTLKRAIDFDLLRQELSHDLVEGPQERYRLDWPGKREALALANAPIRKTLRPCKDESVDFETTRNLYIEGDNLDALKLLQETYLGKVKMIYIDPPYNTGKDFIYDDNFSISREEYQESSGEVDEEGNAMFDEEKWKQNNSANGRFHSEWLSMMYPRLKLARNLLREDGVIFISINDSEVHSLRKICGEIFGAASFLAQLVWRTDGNFDNQAKFKSCHEYILVYARSEPQFPHPPVIDPGIPKTSKLYSKEIRNTIVKNGPANPVSPVTLPRGFPCDIDNGVIPKRNNAWPHYASDAHIKESVLDCEAVVSSGWSSKDLLLEFIANNCKPILDAKSQHTVFTISRTGAIEAIKERSDRQSHVITTLTGLGGSQRAALELEELGVIFDDYPKPTMLIDYLARMNDGEDFVVLDFFSGSATTAHALMRLNAEDGGKRRHIMVQLPHPCPIESKAFKAGYKTIAEIGKERIRRAGKKILEEWQAKQIKEQSKQGDLLDPPSTISDPPTAPDIGFRVLKIDSSNMADVYYQPDELTQDGLMLQVDNLRPGRKPEDLLFQVLLDWGVDLALPITEETILKRRVFFVAEDALAACFDTGLDEDFVKELAKRQPLRAVFRDSGYASDAVKINFEQIFKALSPHTELKTL
jgi:adenine-specific DNA-methyltransferase